GADDLLRLLARLRDDPVALLIDAPRLLHLFRDRDAKLVDEVEHRGLLEHDVVRHRDLSRIDDERFEALDEELDVYVILPQRAERRVASRCRRSAFSASGPRSTNVTAAAPRESASMPSEPAPAKRSRTRAPSSRGSRIAKRVSRMRSVAARVPPPRGTTRVRPLASPAITRMRYASAYRRQS